jgi:hypothetical protein
MNKAIIFSSDAGCLEFRGLASRILKKRGTGRGTGSVTERCREQHKEEQDQENSAE